jgi:glycosyltransferase involved in cell wall biosynthesis
MARLFRKRRIDVVVQATLVPPHGAIAARRAGLPLVWQIVDSGAPAPVRDATMALVRRWSDHVMFCGARLVSLHAGDRPLRVPYEVFYPPVDTDRFRPSLERRAAARAEWNIPPESQVVGMVGNLNPQKGWEYFVRTAALIHRHRPDTRFMMVGASYEVHQEYLHRIEDEIVRSGVPRQAFVMTGDSRRVEDLLPAFDVKLVTSRLRSEGVPTSVLEAFACGIPVVGADVGAVADVVEDGVTGYLARPLDPADIAEKAMRLLSNPDLRGRLALICRERSIALYGADMSARQHEIAFARATAFHARRRHRGRKSVWAVR